MRLVMSVIVCLTMSGCTALGQMVSSNWPWVCMLATTPEIKDAADRWIGSVVMNPVTRAKAEEAKRLADVSAEAACVALKALEAQYRERHRLGLEGGSAL